MHKLISSLKHRIQRCKQRDALNPKICPCLTESLKVPCILSKARNQAQTMILWQRYQAKNKQKNGKHAGKYSNKVSKCQKLPKVNVCCARLLADAGHLAPLHNVKCSLKSTEMEATVASLHQQPCTNRGEIHQINMYINHYLDLC